MVEITTDFPISISVWTQQNSLNFEFRIFNADKNSLLVTQPSYSNLALCQTSQTEIIFRNNVIWDVREVQRLSECKMESAGRVQNQAVPSIHFAISPLKKKVWVVSPPICGQNNTQTMLCSLGRSKTTLNSKPWRIRGIIALHFQRTVIAFYGGSCSPTPWKDIIFKCYSGRSINVLLVLGCACIG